MAIKDDLSGWIIKALTALGGSGRLVDICKYIWKNYEAEWRSSGDLFFTWPYDVRWAGQKRRGKGILIPVHNNRNVPWKLSAGSSL